MLRLFQEVGAKAASKLLSTSCFSGLGVEEVVFDGTKEVDLHGLLICSSPKSQRRH